MPHIITHVETTAAPATDEAALAPIHAALAGRELLPSEHLVDAGYVDSARVVESKEQYDVRLIGPIGVDSSWQAKAGQGYAAADFSVDWAAQRLTCPAGEQSVRWREGETGYGQPVIHAYFAARTCSKCPARALCTKTERAGRVVSIQPQARYEALQAGRKEQRQRGFWQEYRQRAGVEGTMSQGVRVSGMRVARYRGLAKTKLQHILTAVALNLLRFVAWFDERPPARTRVTPFAALVQRVTGMPLPARAGF